MGKWLIAALGVGVVALVVLLVTTLRSEPERAQLDKRDSPSGEPTANPEGSRRAAKTPAGAKGVPAKAVRMIHVPTEDEVGDEGMEHMMAGDIPQRVMAAAAPCYQGEEGRRERLYVDYNLVVDKGHAKLENLKVTKSQFTKRLEQCVLDQMQKLTFYDKRMPNMNTDMEASISILDLKARQPKDNQDEKNEVENLDEYGLPIKD
jgi:hypothetical protein